MKASTFIKRSQQGMTVVEVMVAVVVFGIVVIGFVSGFNSLQAEYALARQYDEMYIVLSACPELDRALQYSALSGSTNCFPNNTFPAEDGGTNTITYTPTVTVTATSSLPNSDPLQTIPNSKVVKTSIGFQAPYTAIAPLQLRMLITQNGIAQ